MSDENKNLEEENEDLIELVDEDGETTVFEHLATLEHKGETYLALCEPEDEDTESEDEKELEVFFLKIETDENGEDYYSAPDDDVADEVFEAFLKLVEETEE